MLICACRTSGNVFLNSRQLVRTSALCVQGNIHPRHTFLCQYDLNWLCHSLTWAPLITFPPSRAVFSPWLGLLAQHSRGQWASGPNTPTIAPQNPPFCLLYTKRGFRYYPSWSMLITRHISLRKHLFNCPRHAPDASAYEMCSSLNFCSLMSPMFHGVMQIQRLWIFAGVWAGTFPLCSPPFGINTTQIKHFLYFSNHLALSVHTLNPSTLSPYSCFYKY